jgi:hypothetical protein
MYLRQGKAPGSEERRELANGLLLLAEEHVVEQGLWRVCLLGINLRAALDSRVESSVRYFKMGALTPFPF